MTLPDKPLLEDWARGRARRDTVFVLGGGPSLPRDLDRVSDARHGPGVLIAANLHALRLVMVNILCWLDADLTPAVLEYLSRRTNVFPPRLVSPFPYSECAVTDRCWTENTGAFAAYLACCMDAPEVVLCGIDGYQGGARYFYGDPASHQRPPLDHVLSFWARAFDRCPNSERIRVASGPLVEVFGQWAPGRSTSASNNSQPSVAV